MQPASEKLATAFQANHQGVQINVQGGGSGAGITAAGQKIADIGSSSRAVKDAEMNTYPTLKTFEVGACAAVFIANPTSVTSATQAELLAAYKDNTYSGNLAGLSAYTRAESSGTKDVVVSWLGSANTTKAPIKVNDNIKTATGSQGMEDAVGSNANSLGYVDFGFAINDPKVHILNLTVTDDVINRKVLGSGGVAVSATTLSFTTTSDNILAELKTDGTKAGTKYPEGLIQPLFYITNGAPNTLRTIIY